MPTLLLLPEFAPQSGVLLTWPHRATDWRQSLPAVEAVYTKIVRAVSRHEKVLVICHDETLRQDVSMALERAAVPATAVWYAVAASNDTWIRDYGPLSVRQDGKPALLNFSFDGWGGKFPAELDNAITRSLDADGWFGAAPCRQHPLVLEGGSIDTDGRGTLLTTTRCLLRSRRNPGHGRTTLEALFRTQLGIRQTLWLDHGYLAGDDTDGHIDMLARFCTPDSIVYTHCGNPDDEHYAELRAMEQQLRGFRNLAGKAYNCIALPLPAPVYNAAGSRLPASYANFLITNAAVLVPVYADPADDIACGILAACFPGREIIPVDGLALIQQFGGLHCATMQLAEGIMHPGKPGQRTPGERDESLRE